MITKTKRAYRTLFLHREKYLRDHEQESRAPSPTSVDRESDESADAKVTQQRPTASASRPLRNQRSRPGSHRESRTATVEKPVDHQKAAPNAPARFPGRAVTALARMTARTAVPNEPPICCVIRVSALECGISPLSRPM